MDELEKRQPFSERLGRLLHARYSAVDAPGVGYVLDPARLVEAQGVERYAWAFRVTETLKRKGPALGIGRIDPAGPPRLAESLKQRRFAHWGLAEMVVATELNDLLLAHGYDVGIGAEAEGVAELRPDEMDPIRAWETIVGLCQASTDVLSELYNMEPDLLPYAYEMAAHTAERVARDAGLRVGRTFPGTARLLVNVGLLMRAVQQDAGPHLRATLSSNRLKEVRDRWPTPERAGTVS